MRPKKYRHRASILVYLEQDLLDQLDAHLGAGGSRSAFVVAAIREALVRLDEKEDRAPAPTTLPTAPLTALLALADRLAAERLKP